MTIDLGPLGGFAESVAEAAARTDDAGSLRRLLASTKPGQLSELLRPALATAVAHSSTEAVQVLVETLGVDACVDVHAGWTALHAAAFLNNEVVAEILVARSADIGFKSNTGQTPKEVATTFGNAEVLYVLDNPTKASDVAVMEEEVFDVGTQCGPEGLTEFAAQTDPPTPPPEQAEAGAQCGPPPSVDACMQIALPFPGVDGAAQTVEPYPEPPPPPPLQAEAAVQHDRRMEAMCDASVQFQPSPGVSSCTQTPAPPSSCDTASQSEQVLRMARSSQTQAPRLFDASAQSEAEPVVDSTDSAAQTIQPRLVESGMQSEQPEQPSFSVGVVQCGPPLFCLRDRAAQHDKLVTVESCTQHDPGPQLVSTSTQHDPAPELMDCATQMSTPQRALSMHALPQAQTDPSLLPGVWAKLQPEDREVLQAASNLKAQQAGGLDGNRDGRADALVSRNRDGIPDGLQQEGPPLTSSPAASSSSYSAWQTPSSADPRAGLERQQTAESEDSKTREEEEAERSALKARALARAERRQHAAERAEVPVEQHHADLKVTGLGRHLKWFFDENGARISNFKDGAVGNLQVGDRLVAVNDQEVDGMSKEHILRVWKQEHGASEFTTLFFQRRVAQSPG
mmetsp:Transcript_74538/g.132116  ORF Transcript_74538/g.132116 Transcript_74538/m.132116 type:complete len:625 (-) Transcript_74538:18-1892(-)